MDFLTFLLFLALVYSVVKWLNSTTRIRKAEADLKQQLARSEELSDRVQRLETRLHEAKQTIDELSPYRGVKDAEQEARRIRSEAAQEADRIRHTADDELKRAKAQAKEALDKARTKADERLAEAQKQVAGAHDQAQAIILKAKREAEQIAGNAYVALQQADSLQKTLQAMEGAVKGYGDSYIVPTHSLLDDLADEFSHTDAGNNLRRAREAEAIETDEAQEEAEMA